MQTTRKLIGEGGGKIILFGEHAVVYGHPAVAAGLRRGARAWVTPAKAYELRLLDEASGEEKALVARDQDEPLSRAFDAMLRAFSVVSPISTRVVVDLPLGSGLGSSAAIATAVARALAAYTDDEEPIEAAVTASETVFHDTPSGIDQLAASTPGIFEFRKTAVGPRTRNLDVAPLKILVCRAGNNASTADMVAGVRALHTQQPEVSFAVDETIGNLASLAADALERSDWQSVGELMNLNHGLLAALGVSTLELDHACHAARRAGALGAKLTGSGGGGCAIAIAPGNEAAVLSAWSDRGWRTYSFEA